MGEITDALRRARLESGGEAPRPEAAEPAPARPPAEPRGADACVAALSRVRSGDWAARVVLVDPRNAVAEAYRSFAIRARAALETRPERTLLVTSALRREGKTTTACNLALALASMAGERRVALVDLDLHRPAVARGLGIRPEIGFERVLDGEVPLAQARIATDLPSLDVYAVVRSRAHAHDLFSGRRFRELLTQLARGYDAVVIDMPPVLILPDVSLVAPHVGACLAVVRARSTPTSAFREMLGRLPHERLLGCFLNDSRLPRHARYEYPYHDDEPADARAAAE